MTFWAIKGRKDKDDEWMFLLDLAGRVGPPMCLTS